MGYDGKSLGRPSRFTPATREALLAALGRGHFRHTAAVAAGVSAGTLRRWVRQGRTDLAAGRETDYGRFWTALQKAEVKAENSLLERAWKIATEHGDGQMIRWLLERRFPHWNDRLTRQLRDVERRLQELEQAGVA